MSSTASETRLPGYVAASDVDELVHGLGLALDPGGLITLRATTFPIDTITRIADADTVLAALDLAGSLDVRERTAGLNALTDALEKLGGRPSHHQCWAAVGQVARALAQRRRVRVVTGTNEVDIVGADRSAPASAVAFVGAITWRDNRPVRSP